MPDAIAARTINFKDLTAPLARRWRVLLAVTLIVGAAAGSAGMLAPRAYTASSTLTVNPITLDPLAVTSSSQQINITTEREILGSAEVARIAAKALGNVSAETLDRSISVDAPSGSTVLQVSATAGTPAQAADWANALANAYLAFRGQGAASLAKTRLDDVNARIAQLDKSSNQSGLADLRSQALALSNIGSNPGRIIGVAVPPTSPSSLALPVYIVGGLIGGLVLAMLLALVRDRFDPRVRFQATLSQLTGAQAFGVRRGDREGFRWLTRQMRWSVSRKRTGPLVVSLFAAGPADVGGVVEGLADIAAAAGLPVILVPDTELAGSRLDGPWQYPFDRADGDKLVIVDAGSVTSAAQQANLAEGSDVVILVAAAGSRRSAVRALVDLLRAAKGKDLLAVFTDRAVSANLVTTRAGALRRPPVDGAAGAEPAPAIAAAKV